MSIGIQSISAFVPRYRLPRAAIQAAWAPADGDSAPAKGARAIAGFDEDALTLAVEAALPIAEKGATGRTIGAVYVASASAPYAEKSAASLLAGACDLPFAGLRTVDLGGTPRAGLQALIAAFERTADATGDALVVASDVRTPPPESEHEGYPGDAAVALLLGRGQGAEGVAAEIVSVASQASEVLDLWRAAGDPFLRSADSRFTQGVGFLPAAKAAVNAALERARIAPATVAWLAVGAPSTAAAAALAKALSIDAAKLCPTFETEIGNTGCAQPLLALAAGFERAKPGDVLVAVGWGDGADAVVLRATDRVANALAGADSATRATAGGREIGGYARYLKSRRLAGADFDAGPESTNVLFFKEQGQNLRLRGARCRACGQVQFPAQGSCVRCRKQGTDPVRLSRRGTVFTFTRDRLNVAAEPVTVMAVVDLDDGARMYLPMTDVDADSVEIGMPVELTFRYYHSGSEFRQYFWKARPVGR